MAAFAKRAAARDDGAPGPRTLVWIDHHRAVIVRWDGRAHVSHVESEVPDHHRSTGHVAHNPLIRHGGGPIAQAVGEGHRLEHRRRYLEQVAALLSPTDPLELIGPGTVREHLYHLISEDDRLHHRGREVGTETASPLTDGQLVARLRLAAGQPAPRGRRPTP